MTVPDVDAMEKAKYDTKTVFVTERHQMVKSDNHFSGDLKCLVMNKSTVRA